jgi:hypothetical protein
MTTSDPEPIQVNTDLHFSDPVAADAARSGRALITAIMETEAGKANAALNAMLKEMVEQILNAPTVEAKSAIAAAQLVTLAWLSANALLLVTELLPDGSPFAGKPDELRQWLFQQFEERGLTF